MQLYILAATSFRFQEFEACISFNLRNKEICSVVISISSSSSHFSFLFYFSVKWEAMKALLIIQSEKEGENVGAVYCGEDGPAQTYLIGAQLYTRA